MERPQSLRHLRLLLHQAHPSLLGYLSVDLTYVVLGWDCKVFRLHNGPIDVLAPVLPHLLLIDDAEELSHKLRVDGDYFDELIPDGEYLVSHDLDIGLDQLGNPVGISIAAFKSSLQWCQALLG